MSPSFGVLMGHRLFFSSGSRGSPIAKVPLKLVGAFGVIGKADAEGRLSTGDAGNHFGL